MFIDKLTTAVISTSLLFILLSFSCSAAAQSNFDKSELFISAEELKQKLESNVNLKIIDVRSSAQYLLGHLPEAVHMWGADLSAQEGWVAELIPEAKIFSLRAQEKGINNDSEIIIYSDADSPWAARLAFIFKYYNHQNVKILNGGYQAWKEKEFESNMLPFKPEEGDFWVEDVNNDWLLSSDTIAENLDNDDFIILDLRSSEEYSGAIKKTGAYRKGRIPGSINLEWSELFNAENKLKSREELQKIFEEKNIPKDKNKTVVLLSHEGIEASHTYFILKTLGYQNLKLYDEAWLGWSHRSDLPVKN